MERHICWSDPKGKELEEKVLGEYSNEEVRKHIEYLSTFIRRAGTEGELKAAKYIKGKLEEYGVDAQIYELDGYISYPGEAVFEILSPVKISLPCNGRTFIPSTGPSGVEAEVIRSIYTLRRKGHSFQSIADTLNEKGVPTKRGGRWYHNTVNYILENPKYQGMVEYYFRW